MDARRRWTLVLLAGASFVAVADTTVVSIALPSMRRELEFSTVGSQWILNAYALAFGGLLLLSGRLGDLLGRKRIFTVGIAVFGVGSILAGLAGNEATLLAGRGIQGTGAAAFVPASLALLTATFHEEGERSRAVGAYGAMAALGFVVGMVGGGVITEFWGWRWVFFVNVPVAALMLATSRTLVESRDPDAERRLDVSGSVLVTGGLVLLIYAMTTMPEQGTSWLVLVTAVTGLTLVLVFLAVERHHPAPLVPLRWVARAAVLVPNVAVALQSMVGIAWLYVLTLYFQDVLGRGPLETGLLFAPMTLAALVAAPVAGRQCAQRGPRTTALLGLTTVGTGVGMMIAGVSSPDLLGLVVAGMVVGESGFMFSNVALTVAATTSLDDAQAGLGAGLLNTFIQLGSGVGLGVVALVIAMSLPGDAGPADPIALRWGLVACLLFVAVATALVARGMRAGRSIVAGDAHRSP